MFVFFTDNRSCIVIIVWIGDFFGVAPITQALIFTRAGTLKNTPDRPHWRRALGAQLPVEPAAARRANIQTNTTRSKIRNTKIGRGKEMGLA